MDYYSTLGLQRGASEAEIKKAYRGMAMKHHPDRGGDEKKFLCGNLTKADAAQPLPDVFKKTLESLDGGFKDVFQD
jgi:curved DNA-binding protein CbpA